mmetsp:Transcript_6971/g.42680  ORF Transcript_6971/g.42680 Transcript_6971/m.42680 type:complete len:214 (+) Transcript_6971:5280-5921(+)
MRASRVGARRLARRSRRRRPVSAPAAGPIPRIGAPPPRAVREGRARLLCLSLCRAEASSWWKTALSSWPTRARNPPASEASRPAPTHPEAGLRRRPGWPRRWRSFPASNRPARRSSWGTGRRRRDLPARHASLLREARGRGARRSAWFPARAAAVSNRAGIRCVASDPDATPAPRRWTSRRGTPSRSFAAPAPTRRRAPHRVQARHASVRRRG